MMTEEKKESVQETPENTVVQPEEKESTGTTVPLEIKDATPDTTAKQRKELDASSEEQKERFTLRGRLKLKWYYFITFGMGVFALLISLLGATYFQESVLTAADGKQGHASPFAFLIPLVLVHVVCFLVFMLINALCAFKLISEDSKSKLHFVCNLLLYLAVVVGIPLSVAFLQL